MPLKKKQSVLSPEMKGSQNRIVLILGKKGRGKTHLIMTVFMPELLSGRLIVFDFHGEYKDPRLLRAENLQELQQFLSENDTEKCWAVVWTPKRMTELPYFLEICYSMRNCWIIFEEVNARGLGNLRQPDPVFIDLVNFGRNKNISMICVAKRPAQVSRDLTSQADIIISFRQDEPNDIKYLQEFCGPGVEKDTMGLSDHNWAIVYPAIDPEKGE